MAFNPITSDSVILISDGNPAIQGWITQIESGRYYYDSYHTKVVISTNSDLYLQPNGQIEVLHSATRKLLFIGTVIEMRYNRFENVEYVLQCNINPYLLSYPKPEPEPKNDPFIGLRDWLTL